MITLTRNAPTPEHTRVIAEDFSALLRLGDLVQLVGEMGAGKTTFVRHLAQSFGVDPSAVSSPTYVIMNIYPTTRAIGERTPEIAHLDCYRLGDDSELDALGWDQIIGNGTIVLIEWPERIAGSIPEDSIRISIDHVDETSRRFRFEIPEAFRERAGFDAIVPRPETTCPVTGQRVSGDCLSWPFASERARMADLNSWFSEKHVISRPMEEADLEQGE